MKKSIIAVTSMMLVMSGALAVNAEEIDTTRNPANTSATITFEQGNEKPEVINPVDPEVTPEGTGQTGALTLNYVPTLDFGTHKLSSEYLVANNIQNKDASGKVVNPAFMQVTDLRGNREGWDVQVKMGAFTTEKDNQVIDTLEKAQVKFNKGDVKYVPSTPLTDDQTSRIMTKAPTTQESTTVVAGGDAVSIFNAAKGDGAGKWHQTWIDGDSSIQFIGDVSQAYAATYNATAEWTIINAPTNSTK